MKKYLIILLLLAAGIVVGILVMRHISHEHYEMPVYRNVFQHTCYDNNYSMDAPFEAMLGDVVLDSTAKLKYSTTVFLRDLKHNIGEFHVGKQKSYKFDGYKVSVNEFSYDPENNHMLFILNIDRWQLVKRKNK